jgi:hypothetical protein
MHLTVEQLIKEKEFNAAVSEMIARGGRTN